MRPAKVQGLPGRAVTVLDGRQLPTAVSDQAILAFFLQAADATASSKQIVQLASVAITECTTAAQKFVRGHAWLEFAGSLKSRTNSRASF